MRSFAWCLVSLAVLLGSCVTAAEISPETIDLISRCSAGVSSQIDAKLTGRIEVAIQSSGNLNAGLRRSVQGAFFSQGWDQDVAAGAYKRYVDCVEGRASIMEAAVAFDNRSSLVRVFLSKVPGVTADNLRVFDEIILRRRNMLVANQIAAFYTAGEEQNQYVASILPADATARSLLAVRGLGVLFVSCKAMRVDPDGSVATNLDGFSAFQLTPDSYCECATERSLKAQCIRSFMKVAAITPAQ